MIAVIYLHQKKKKKTTEKLPRKLIEQFFLDINPGKINQSYKLMNIYSIISFFFFLSSMGYIFLYMIICTSVLETGEESTFAYEISPICLSLHIKMTNCNLKYIII